MANFLVGFLAGHEALLRRCIARPPQLTRDLNGDWRIESRGAFWLGE